MGLQDKANQAGTRLIRTTVDRITPRGDNKADASAVLSTLSASNSTDPAITSTYPALNSTVSAITSTYPALNSTVSAHRSTGTEAAQSFHN